MRVYGNHCKKGERRAEAEVQLPQAQPVPTVRAAARFFAQVWRLPLVFPGAAAQGGDSRRPQVELVEKPVNSEQWSVLLLLERTAEVKARFFTDHCPLF